MLKTSSAANRRVVNAPPPTIPSSATLSPNRVLSVVLEPDEDIEWIWTAAAGGGEYVCGYNIVKKENADRARR